MEPVKETTTKLDHQKLLDYRVTDNGFVNINWWIKDTNGIVSQHERFFNMSQLDFMVMERDHIKRSICFLFPKKASSYNFTYNFTVNYHSPRHSEQFNEGVVNLLDVLNNKIFGFDKFDDEIDQNDFNFQISETGWVYLNYKDISNRPTAKDKYFGNKHGSKVMIFHVSRIMCLDKNLFLDRKEDILMIHLFQKEIYISELDNDLKMVNDFYDTLKQTMIEGSNNEKSKNKEVQEDGSMVVVI